MKMFDIIVLSRTEQVVCNIKKDSISKQFLPNLVHLNKSFNSLIKTGFISLSYQTTEQFRNLKDIKKEKHYYLVIFFFQFISCQSLHSDVKQQNY